MLATFFALVFVLFVGQIAAGIWLKTNEERFTKLAMESVAVSIKHDYSKNEVKTEAFDIIQSKLKCCGSQGPTDWAESRYNGAHEGNSLEIGVAGGIGMYAVPPSCCVNPGTVCDTVRQLSISGIIPGTIHTDGCVKKILQLIVAYSLEILGVLLAILLIEILAMVFSIVLCCTVRRIDHVKA